MMPRRYIKAMTSNHKLTGVLKGRTISGSANQGDVLKQPVWVMFGMVYVES